jgi:hypothetical protein
VATKGWILDYDVGVLRAGWYHSFGLLAFPPDPADMKFVQTIRLSDDDPPPDGSSACSACPTWIGLAGLIEANPGSLWLVGNEPDRQDYIHPERYAELYHQFHSFIKSRDRASQVAIGGVVQPTPVRLQYLDLILAAYQDHYGSQLPVDVWNTHNYILREKRYYPGCPDCWGAGIPPGVADNTGILYEIEDHDDFSYWIGHLTLLRQWMRDRGYRDRPLIVSEFGILMPADYGFNYQRVTDFMQATFNWMLKATDPDTGYPGDGNRLVQAWSWYSLDDSGFEGWLGASHLFDPDSKSVTNLGLDFAAITTPLQTPAIDLEPVAIWHGPPEPEGNPLVSFPVMTSVFNSGAAEAKDVLVRFERDGGPAGEVLIPSILPGETQQANVMWYYLFRGMRYDVTVSVSAEAGVAECDLSNNRLSVPLLATDISLHLPLLTRSR